ncbi:hypothetical protein E2C01_083919 [Portunus trituberculatus]|uniref:Uncharacterized protein n=1 Tax=Portunus trituberculatus TaxID=210409 RepID=A0A5B7ITY8_PORTR|nr:hypothetical protein [Portunus trituberculatus]
MTALGIEEEGEGFRSACWEDVVGRVDSRTETWVYREVWQRLKAGQGYCRNREQ